MLFADCTVDVGSLLEQWKKFDTIWQGSGFCSSWSSLGDPSISDVDEGEFEFLRKAEASLSPRTVSWEAALSPMVTIAPPG